MNQVKRTYNGFGQVTNEYQQQGGTVTIGTTRDVAYTYDTSGHGSRLTGESLFDGGFSYVYTVNALDNAISRVDEVSGTAGTVLYSYLGLSTVVIQTNGDSTKLTYVKQSGESNGDAGDKYTGLDRFGRIVDQRWISGTLSLDRYQYTYDRDSNVLTMVNVNHTRNNVTYTYDGLNRLTAADVANGTAQDQTWSLDAIGNMTAVTTGSTTVNRTTNSDNQVTAVTGHSLAYDSNGNLTTDDQGHTLVYDAWNRLVEVTDSSGVLIAAYTYDGLGRLVTSTDGYTQQNLYYNTGGQLVETRAGGATTGIYLWSITYIDALVSRNSGGSTLYAMYDADFDVTGVESGSTVQERFVYTAGGAFTVDTSSWSGTTDSKSWTVLDKGMQYDAAIGWYMDRARIYSPTLQVFGQSEPSTGSYIDGMDLQWAFAANPINRMDPTGLLSAGTTKITFPVSRNAAIANMNLSNVDGSYIPNRGHFSAQMVRSAGAADAFIDIKFHPTNDITDSALCDRIEFVQIIESYTVYHAWYAEPGLTDADFAEKIDARSPSLIYPFPTSTWNRNPGSYGGFSEMTDAPGPKGAFGVEIVAFTIRTYAIATKGAEAGHSYGYLRWGATIDFMDDFANIYIDGIKSVTGTIGTAQNIPSMAVAPHAGSLAGQKLEWSPLPE